MLIHYTGSNTSTEDILNKDIVSGNKLKDLIGAIKQAISVLKTSLEKTNSTVSATAQAVNQHESDIGTLVTSVGINTSNITSLSKSINDINALANTIKNNQYNIEQLGRYINVLRNEKYLWTRKISLDISTSIQSGDSFSMSGWLSGHYDIYTEQALSAKVIEVFSNATEASGYKVTDDLEIETDWGTYTVAYSDSLRLINRNSSSVYVDHVLIEVLFVGNEDRSITENNILDTEFEYDEYYS